MTDTQEPSSAGKPKRPDVANAIIGAIAAVIVAVLALIGVIITQNHSGHDTSSVALPPSVQASSVHHDSSLSSTLSRPACPSTLAITSPTNGQQVLGADGVQVSGTACGLSGGESGWLFDQDTSDSYYYEVYPSNPGPVTNANGAWTILDQPIGSKGNIRKTYYVTLVLASSSCGFFLQHMPRIDGDFKIQYIPAGCQIVQKVSVTVTYP